MEGNVSVFVPKVVEEKIEDARKEALNGLHKLEKGDDAVILATIDRQYLLAIGKFQTAKMCIKEAWRSITQHGTFFESLGYDDLFSKTETCFSEIINKENEIQEWTDKVKDIENQLDNDDTIEGNKLRRERVKCCVRFIEIYNAGTDINEDDWKEYDAYVKKINALEKKNIG